MQIATHTKKDLARHVDRFQGAVPVGRCAACSVQANLQGQLAVAHYGQQKVERLSLRGDTKIR
ncbi:MAG TPA: hypothetical protein VG758_18550 [Hyphomicrobiaceae bacterium]|nr:hypothetical protein [Hyphomicrobiaceae bacterium]